jgi:activator of HSP90 ATPase
MKSLSIASGLSALLLLACACSASVSTSNSASNTAAANTANSAQPSNAANAPASNASNTSSVASNTAPSNAANATEGGKQDFTLVNSTGVEINKVFISPHDKDDWEEDILGRDTLPNGQTVDIKFHRDEPAAMWDLRVEDTKGNSIEWENLDLLKISKVTLHYENGRAWADTE